MSGGGGKGAGKQGSAALEGFLREFQQQSGPARQELFGQVFEALRTGGVGARLPLVQRSLEETKAATSQALTGTGESLARSGLAGTPFGERILAETRQRGEVAEANIPTQFARELIAVAPGLALGSAQTAAGGFGQLAQTGAQREAANLQFLASIFQSSTEAGATAGAAK